MGSRNNRRKFAKLSTFGGSTAVSCINFFYFDLCNFAKFRPEKATYLQVLNISQLKEYFNRRFRFLKNDVFHRILSSETHFLINAFLAFW